MGKFGKIIVTANLVTDPDESETHSYHDSAVVCQVILSTAVAGKVF